MSTSTALSDEAARLAQFLTARVAFDHDTAAGEAEWRDQLAAAYADLLAVPWEVLVPQKALEALLDALGDERHEKGFAAPLTHGITKAVYDELGQTTATVGHFVPPAARAAIAELIARPRAIPVDLVKRLFEDNQALEEAMGEVLFVSIKEFNEKVNPFFAEWGLPGLLKRLMPIGFGAVSKSLDSVRGEFDKRLEPEITKFLQGFSKKALARFADFIAKRVDEPPMIATRGAMVSWLYDQPVSFLTAATDAAALRLGTDAYLAIVAHIQGLPDVRTRRTDVLTAFYKTHGPMPVADLLATLGGTGTSGEPDWNAVAAATFPLVRAGLKTDAAHRWLRQIASEFMDQGSPSPADGASQP